MLRGLQQMDCVSFFIWVRRVKIRITFTCRQIATEKSSNITEAFEQREFRFRLLEIWVSEPNFDFFLLSKNSLRGLQAEFKDTRLSEKRPAPTCCSTQATSISSAGAACTSPSVGSARSSGVRRRGSARLQREAPPDMQALGFVTEREGAGPAAAEDAAPHPRSQPGPPPPGEAIAISTAVTIMCGEWRVVGPVSWPACPPSRAFWEVPPGDLGAPWLCLFSRGLSQSLVFSLRVCHFALPD